SLLHKGIIHALVHFSPVSVKQVLIHRFAFENHMFFLWLSKSSESASFVFILLENDANSGLLLLCCNSEMNALMENASHCSEIDYHVDIVCVTKDSPMDQLLVDRRVTSSEQ
ncbi:hypothetical protein AVEN_96366-1, partial [Araneus ventricosus]